MEFLDPKKQRAHLIRLMVGYVLIGIALILTTIILLYQAYGFGLKNGEVIQNGLIFVSSRPNPADIYVNGKKDKATTNTRLLMPAGQYVFELKRDGYRDWKRAVTVEGGSIGRFDYPVLFPTKLTTTTTKKYDVRPTVATQSPDKRWLVEQSSTTFNEFESFDLNAPTKAPVAFTVPTSLFTLGDGAHAWKLVEWANDNQHVLLQHLVTKDAKQTSEYILVDREKPEESTNLTKTLGVNPTKIELQNKKYDKYFLFDEASHQLSKATLSEPAPILLLDHVLAFKTHGDDMVLYATDLESPAGKVTIKLKDGNNTYTIRQVSSATSSYMLDLAQYSGDWYVVAGASVESKTYVYKNPINKLQNKPDDPLVPVQVLKAANPTFIDFSDNARFIVAENGQQFSIYDAETDKGYTYTSKYAVDAPQVHATWMDGNHLMYVSGGKTVVLDFDDANREVLVAADANYLPVFDRDYKFLYSFAQQTVKGTDGQDTTQFGLTSTLLLTPADQ